MIETDEYETLNISNINFRNLNSKQVTNTNKSFVQYDFYTH